MNSKNKPPHIDAIIAAVSNYEKEQVAVWFNSLLAAGFAGRILVVAYDVSFDLVDYMRSKGALVRTFDRDEKRRRYTYSQFADEMADRRYEGRTWTDARWYWNRMVQRLLGFADKVHDRRHFHCWEMLRDHCAETGDDFRFLAFADIKDVVFQSDPFAWLARNLKKDEGLAVSVEPVTHEEDWNRKRTLKVFGAHAFERARDVPVVCCGYFAGRFSTVHDSLLAGYYTNQTKRFGDQQGFNQMLLFEPWRRVTRYTDWTIPWVGHLATALASPQPAGFYADRATLPVFRDGMVRTHDGQPFAVVHQYDRFPEMKAHFEGKYGFDAMG